MICWIFENKKRRIYISFVSLIEAIMDRPIALASSGGTAFPICTNCLFFLPSNMKSSGKDCRRAISLAVNTLGSLGGQLTPP